MPRRYQKPRPETLSPHERTAIAYATLDVRLPLSTDATKSSPSPIELNRFILYSAPTIGSSLYEQGRLLQRSSCSSCCLRRKLNRRVFPINFVAVTADWFRLVSTF